MPRTARFAAVMLIGMLVAGSLARMPVTLARLTGSAGAAASFTTQSLLPPTALAASGGPIASLTWTPSTSTAAAGYDVLRSATSGFGYAVVGTVTPVTATSTTDSPGSGTWYYVLQTTLQSWTSPSSNQASVVVSTGATGFRPCAPASNATDTGGDNDGYETNAGNGCLADGTTATDAGSGTNTVNSCTNAGKDRHRFWGYALGLPATVTSIDGIEIQLVAGMSNNGGTTLICAQLSWDGGTTWTAPQSVSLIGTALATYTLGAPTDTWGRAWAVAELDPANLRVRLVDVTTQANKTFRLDGLAVQVHYTP